MSDLKPCPFCGGEANLRTIIRSDCAPVYQSAYVICHDCAASSREIKDTEHNGQHVFKAIEAWNRRAEEEKKMDVYDAIERVERLLDKDDVSYLSNLLPDETEAIRICIEAAKQVAGV